MRLLLTLIFAMLLTLIRVDGYSQQLNELEIEVMNIEEPIGNLMIAVYSKEDDFLGDKNFAGKVAKVSKTPSQKVSFQIPFGEYAVAIYQDLNADGELNTNFLGIPKEPYGFSNDSMGMLSPPDFEEASFSFNTENLVIEISLL